MSEKDSNSYKPRIVTSLINLDMLLYLTSSLSSMDMNLVTVLRILSLMYFWVKWNLSSISLGVANTLSSPLPKWAMAITSAYWFYILNRFDGFVISDT